MEQPAAVEVVESFAARIKDRHGDYANTLELARKGGGKGEGDDAAHGMAHDVRGAFAFDDGEEEVDDALEGIFTAGPGGIAIAEQVGGKGGDGAIDLADNRRPDAATGKQAVEEEEADGLGAVRRVWFSRFHRSHLHMGRDRGTVPAHLRRMWPPRVSDRVPTSGGGVP